MKLYRYQKTIVLYEDNQACIALSKNPKRTKHIQVKYHVLRDYVQRGLTLEYVPIIDQLADIFTKGGPGG